MRTTDLRLRLSAAAKPGPGWFGKGLLRSCGLALLWLPLLARAGDQVVISEFMAGNQDTLRDGYGNASDWIELCNAGTNTVNLAGWHLTDDPLNPLKWTFPDVTLSPARFLVVFASGLGVPDPGGNLHANFQLSTDGEYLALIRPDGTSVASEFSPAYLPQRTDVSYGLGQGVAATTLIGSNPPARLLVPTAADDAQIGSTWTGGSEPFNDAAWSLVTAPVGFDSDPILVTNLVNIALGRPVTAAGPTWDGLPKENLTDGNLATFTHNLTPVPDFYFIVDLGGVYPLENIELFNRADGCCPDRLSNFTVSLHADAGPTLGPVVWSTNIRTNGSNSGVGGRDLVTPNLDPDGIFAGRWIKVQSRTNSGNRYFQIAELRANTATSDPGAANLAQGAAVFASGPTWEGFPAGNLTDGSTATFSHNLTMEPAFTYQVRLTQSVVFMRLELVNRHDCCPDRLSNYRLSIHPDAGGGIGPPVWTAHIRTDGSDSGMGGVDVITPNLNPAGSFEGQWIQIQNLDNGSARYLQIAEVRAFGLAGSSGYAPLLRTDLTAQMKNISASAYLRLPFAVTNSSRFPQLTLRVKYDDGFVARLNGVEVARRNAPPGAPAYSAQATASHFGSAAEEFDVPGSLLHEGTNILALHGLNLSTSDRDFLLSPELVGLTISPGGYGYLTQPTPGTLNGTNTVAGFVDDPRFSIDRGFFEAPLDVVITNPTPGAALVYTTDSSTPSLTNGIVLLPPAPDASITVTVRVSTTTILRAAAFQSGLEPSKIDTHTYLFLGDVIRQPANPAGFPATWNGFAADYEMDPEVVTNAAYRGEIVNDLRGIPTMSVVLNPSDLFGPVNGIYTFSEQIGDAWERAASVELIKPDGSTGFQMDCGLRIWGTGWRPHSASPKHAFQLKFKDRYGAKRLRYPLFPDAPVNEFEHIVLRAQGSRSWSDFRQPDITQAQYIHDSWARDTRRDMNTTDGHATYVHLYLNGLYWGLYNPVERTDDGFAEIYYGGSKTNYDVLTRRFTVEPDAGDLAAWNAMMTIVNAGLATPEAYARVQQYLDVDDFIDYMMLHQYASNHDGPTYNGNNMRAIRRRVPAGPFRFHVWDMEYTMWYAQENNLGVDIDQCPARIFQKLRENPEFRLRYADHAQRHLCNNGALTPAAAAARWLARADEIYGAVVGESARWGDVRRATPPYTRNVEWTAELNRLMTEYFPVRTQILLDQLKQAGLYPTVAAPTFNQPGGEVLPGFSLQIDAPGGTVYFTLDGTDPRLPGGGISPNATAYLPTTPLVRSTGALVRVSVPLDDSLGARWNGSDPGFDDSTWLSSTHAAGFDATTPPAPSPVPLRNASADFSQAGYPVTAAIDGNAAGGGWGLFQADFVNKGRVAVAVFETVTNVGFPDGTRLVFTLRHNAVAQGNLGKFRLSATTDDRSQFADGLVNAGDVTASWLPLKPLTVVSLGGATLTINDDATVLATGVNPAFDTYTVTALTPLTNLTGLRLEAMEDPALPNRGPGRAGDGNAVLTEISLQAGPATLNHLLDAAFAAQVRAAMQNQNASAYLRMPFTVETNALFHHLTLRVRYEDGFVAYLNGREAARRNAPATPAWNSASAIDRPKSQALDFEEMDVTPALPFLAPGTNVLAFQAFNSAATNADFLLQAELMARTDLPITLADSTTVNARARLDGEWSALSEATFIASVPLRVTEIMYNPPGAGAVDGENFEFLELKNTGAVPFDLSGLTFTAGITFTFTNGAIVAPGRFFVLARNAAQFASRYPGVTVHGIYSGKLDNAGETLTLSRPPGGGAVLSVSYNDAAPWPALADGFGFSLVPKRAAANPDPNEAVNWRASSRSLGSPGTDDPEPGLPPILVNEVLSASTLPRVDAVELLNPTSTNVHLGGWFLSDDRAWPTKFRIPDGTNLPPGGYIVFDETQFNPAPGAPDSFALSAHGDSIYLFSGDANTNLTGYSHGFAFGAGADGVSFGRHVISTGEEQFPAQSALTLDGPNGGPRVGPVVITEIMYHPPPGGDEFIELKNITTNAVDLFDPANPANTWKLGGLNYTLPANGTLAANSFLLLVSADPAVFRAKYGVPADVQILGPCPGVLQDSGERLELMRPGTPDTNGVPYITVDEVRYNDKLPWPPLADGFGPSLQRLDAAAYGNDPAHWRAAAPGLGADFAGGVAPAITVQPVSQVVLRSATVRFNVSASGTGPFQYQWRFRGTNLPYATDAALVLTDVQLFQSGPYQATVLSSAGAVTSAVAILTVLDGPVISVHPQGRTVAVGTNVTFSVTATGTGPLAYQWRFNGTNIDGATASSLTLSNVQEPQSGEYTVVVTDSVTSTASQPAALLVVAPPAIIAQPQSVTAVVGDTVRFSVSASGTLPLSYRWRSNGVTLTNIILHSHTSVHTIANVRTNHAARYSVTITNSMPPPASTLQATLTVLLDTDGDHLPDVWETQYGFSPTNPADGTLDSDGDGLNNWQEYIAGTNPTNALSRLRIQAALAGGNILLTFEAVSNRSYTLQRQNSLTNAAWSTLADWPARATNFSPTIPDLLSGTNRFYRLVTPQQP